MFKKLFKKSVFIILVLTSFSSFAQKSSPQEKLFFENPTIVKLIENLPPSSEIHAQTKLQIEKILFFFATAFKSHSDLSKEIIINFAKYDLPIQELLFSGLLYSNVDLPSDFKHKYKDLKVYSGFRDVANSKFSNNYTNIDELQNNIDLVDLYWIAFTTSGDQLYIEKILKFLTAHSELVKDISRDYTNREIMKEQLRTLGANSDAINYDDLISAAEKDNILYQVIGHRAVSWSIKSMSSSYNRIDKVIEKIFNKNKNLERC